ncbi:hypothetical protein MTO96_035655 [Rhipicephalus appendiculatus]
MLSRAAQEADFALWLLTVASGPCSRRESAQRAASGRRHFSGEDWGSHHPRGQAAVTAPMTGGGDVGGYLGGLRLCSSGAFLRGGGGDSRGEDWGSRHPRGHGSGDCTDHGGGDVGGYLGGAAVTSAEAPAVHTAEYSQPEGMDLDQALLVILETE